MILLIPAVPVHPIQEILPMFGSFWNIPMTSARVQVSILSYGMAVLHTALQYALKSFLCSATARIRLTRDLTVLPGIR